MPEENIIDTNVQTALDNLEDHHLDNHLSRTNGYNVMLNALENDNHIDATVIQRLLKVCVHDMTTLKYTTTVISIIKAVLLKIKESTYQNPPPDLEFTALAIMRLIKTICLRKADSLLSLCYDTLVLYPDDTLIAIGTDHCEEVVEIFNISFTVHTRIQACSLLLKLLKILPPEKKKVLVAKGVSVWFSKTIPTVMLHLISTVETDDDIIIKILELLTNDLVHLDYTKNSHWQTILECICNTKQYPSVIKNLLQAGNGNWSRLWIVFIRLLKDQVTLPIENHGTPINSMLPVVETAFKLDVPNRCKAFECWNVLIDSFATETNESHIYKRIKLLVIPLKSNNARAEATALTKFQCWWHLIRSFQNKMDKFLDTILVSFLHFCFGRHNAPDKSVVIPGQISASTKKYGNEAIVEMFGHVNCDGCTNLPKLKGKVVNTKHLVDNWNHWIYSLTSVIMKTAKTNNGLTKQQMSCLWKSFLMTIGDLPENNIRKDLVAEILSIIFHLVQECKSNIKFLDIAFNVLILSLFEEDTNIKHLLKSDKDPNDPLIRIAGTVLDSSLYGYYKSCPTEEIANKMKTITKFIADPDVCVPNNTINVILGALPSNDYSLLFWNALLESVGPSVYDNCLHTCKLMFWPLKSINLFSDVQVPAMTWYKTFDLIYPKLNKTEIEKAIDEVLSSNTDKTSAVFFKICVVLGILKHKYNESTTCEREIKMLKNFTDRMESYANFEKVMPILVDRTVAIMNNVTLNVNEQITEHILVCIKNQLNILSQTSYLEQTEIMVGNLLKHLEELLAVESYSKLISAITSPLLKSFQSLYNQPKVKNGLLPVLKLILTKTESTNENYKEIQNVISNIENGVQGSEGNKFTAPQTKKSKQNKKKEANIVNTVVENGEEYVVVKSNWKFNPRKLTENQKEKLQRKREDIPALYQDLSQSQDEFKLVSWKTDSQDTTSNSKSESRSSKAGEAESATEILKKIPSTNVVPKILENFFSENDKKDIKTTELPKQNTTKVGSVTPTAKNTKSPRMALKDRVFRNVRNLIENSGIQKENKDSPDESNHVDNISKTPTQTKNNNLSNVVNSAPPMLSADRPCRTKRKPKKFEDLQLLSSKKSRHSLHEVRSGRGLSVDESSDGKEDLIIDKKDIPSEQAAADNKHVNESDALNENQDVNIVIENKSTKQEGCANDGNNDESESKDKIIQNIVNNSNEVIHLSSETDLVKLPTSKTTNYMKEVTIAIPKVSNDELQVLSKGIKDNSLQANKTDINKTSTAVISESSTPNIIKSVKETDVISSPKNTKVLSEKSSINQTNSDDGLDVEISSTPKSNKSASSTVPLTPKTSNNFENVSNLKVLVTPISTDISSSKTSKVSQKELTPKVAKDAKEAFTPKISKEIKESSDVSTPKMSDEVKESPKISPKRDNEESGSTVKKKTVKKSRIEKELAIDTVEGHPYLKPHSEKRLTRKAVESTNTGRRKSLSEKLHKTKEGTNQKKDKKIKENIKDIESISSTPVIVDETQEEASEPRRQLSFSDELPHSDDVIESSQDSTITTVSVRSTRKTLTKRVPLVCVEKISSQIVKGIDTNNSQSILDGGIGVIESPPTLQDNKEDSILPLNKTVLEEKTQDDLTANMDTEPLDEQEISDDVILISDDAAPLTIASEHSIVGPETQEIAEADTQPTDPKEFMDVDVTQDDIPTPCETSVVKVNKNETETQNIIKQQTVIEPKNCMSNTLNNSTVTLSESVCADIEQSSGASSPFKDEAQRQQDFLNNTIEISPIKTMSPDRNKKSPSPETSGDYVVIQLSSPVNSNGEPLEKGGSPEVFTEDKLSPDKRDQSPPRTDISVTVTSPSSSLSLKKNRPQVRSGGRAAQMLGLCVPDKVQAIVNPDKNESEELKKTTPTTPARRNLRILYNSVSENIESSNNPSENDDSENFLKFRRSLPAVDSSPSGPILKRKLAEITDDATVSPASKRKRVSFHDPPVSTTISVQKYIEPGGVRSPQNSAQKRLERQLRQHTPIRSPKRLDNVFKLDTVLTKTVESFSDSDIIPTADDTQQFSLDETPVVEIVRASELNDTEPICPDLVDCKDHIENIAAELSSPAMKPLLIIKWQGKIETVGDLAKMTELEVNRLCISAPKVKVARKVLTEYAAKIAEKAQSEMMLTVDAAEFDKSLSEATNKGIHIEIQTDKNESTEMEMQTEAVPTSINSSQTEVVATTTAGIQTDVSGSKSMTDVIKSYLSKEKQDFVTALGENLEEQSIEQISEKLPIESVTDMLMKKMTTSSASVVFSRILEQQSGSTNDKSKELTFIRDFICDRFDSKDLILLCSQMLKVVYDKPA